MTTAVLSFATPGIVALRCPDLVIEEQRPLTGDMPFAAWSRAYAAHLHDPDQLLALGLQIGTWFDGDERWLDRLVDGATAPLVLEIETRTRTDQLGILALDAPWELLARRDPAGRAAASASWAARPSDSAVSEPAIRRDLIVPRPVAVATASEPPVDLEAAYHLALDPGLCFGPVRRIGPATVPRPPSPYRLSVVFMAAQPDGVTGLDVEREEEALRDATGDLGLDLLVDETGSVDGLAETLARAEACDVAHVTCHGLAEPRPVLLFEGEDGRRIDVTADDLAGAIAGQPPALTFLSACSTAAASSAGRSLASDLCRRGWSAVLGWSAPVGDRGAIRYAALLYRQLARRQLLVDAVAMLRRDVGADTVGDLTETSTWHLPRLFLGPTGGARIVDGTRPRIVRARAPIELLAAGPSRAPSPTVEPNQRRRALQRIQSALARGARAGAFIHGGNAWDRTSLAQRLVRRWPDLRPVVVTRHFDPVAVLAALARDLVDDEIHAIVERHRDVVLRRPEMLAIAVREMIEGPAQRAGQGAFVLVVHGLEHGTSPQNTTATGAPPAHAGTVIALVTAFRGAATEARLVMTCDVRFASVDATGDDVVDGLQVESLGTPT